MTRPVITARTVAALIGRKYDWFCRGQNRNRLYCAGFPRPLPGPGHPRWNRAAVMDWLRTARDMADTPPAERDRMSNIINLPAQRARLMAQLAPHDHNG